MKHLIVALTCACLGATVALTAQPLRPRTLTCAPDNGGLTLPDRFCAQVVADRVGAARHIAVGATGDIYVSIQDRGGDPAGGVALRDTNGDGIFDQSERFGDKSTTGIAIRNGYVYTATTTTVERFKLSPDTLRPGPAEIVVSGLPLGRPHQDKGIAFDGLGHLYVNVGAPSNACQPQDRRPRVAGQDPCPLLETTGGIWRFDESRLNQTQADGMRYATGLRQMPALAWHEGSLYLMMHNRDQLDTLWSDHFTPEDNQTRPAEALYRVAERGNYGWPYCFFDYGRRQLLLNPEYGGDGTTVGRCDAFTPPIAAFPAHWAPVDLMFYTGTQFPAKYRGGAFIAFHGSWNRAPASQDGYNVTFQPFANGAPVGGFEVFADGFAVSRTLRSPNDAVYRADGVAQARDGSLYIAESNTGRIWQVVYRGR